MSIANVAISNTFNEFRVTTNEAITQINAFTEGTGDLVSNTVTANTVTVSDLTSGRVALVGTSGILQDDSGLTYDTGTNGLTVAGTLEVGGIATFTSNVEIEGNLIITGNTVTLNVESKVIEDPLIYLASNNYVSDLVDIGFVGNYYDGANQQHTGIVRHHLDNRMYFFTGYEEEPTNNVIDVYDASFVPASVVAGNAEFNYISANGVATDLTFLSTGQINVPVGDTGERAGDVTGAFRFNTDSSSFEGYNGSEWGAIGGAGAGAVGGGDDELFYENGQFANTSYTITSGKNAMTTGPITVANGVSLTVPSGSRLVIL